VPGSKIATIISHPCSTAAAVGQTGMLITSQHRPDLPNKRRKNAVRRGSMHTHLSGRFRTLLLTASVLFVHQLSGQTFPPLGCPEDVTDPTQMLRGRWTFSLHGFAMAPAVGAPGFGPFASAGQFIATGERDKAGNPQLVLISTASHNGQTVARLEVDAGTYSVRPDCSGGTINFNLSTRPIQFDYWFADGRIHMVSTTSGVTVNGKAERVRGRPVLE
jgi:hypothetical protein